MSEPGTSRKPLPVLPVTGLSKRFTVGGQTVEALRNVDLRIEKGEFVCLIGASGCGKSTLLRILAGFEAATEGSVEMYGKPIHGPSPERGMVFQDYGLFPWLTVAQNIAFGALDALTRERLQHELLEIWARTGVTVIFVTHAVEEAVMLSDRVVVMTAGPGRIERDIPLGLARPREITGIEFNQVRRDITRYLSSHVAVKSAA